MQTYAATSPAERTSSVSAENTSKQSDSGSFAFTDRRPESVAQRKLQEMAGTFSAGESVAQLRTLVPRPAHKGGGKPRPEVTVSANFDANHIAADVTEDAVKTRRANRGVDKNTLLKESALVDTARNNRATLVARTGVAPPGGTNLTELSFKKDGSEAKTATYNGGEAGNKSDVNSADVSNVSKISVMTRVPAGENVVEIFHIEASS